MHDKALLETQLRVLLIDLIVHMKIIKHQTIVLGL